MRSLTPRPTNLSKVSLGCDVSWDTRTSSLSVAGVYGWAADILPQPAVGEVHMHIFLDRSVLEVYSGGAAVTLSDAFSRRTFGSS
jgi:hypothetical protein